MIDTKTIKRMARGILKHGHKINHDNRIMHPQREWVTCISVGLVLFAYGVWWSVDLYRDYSATVFDATPATEARAGVYRETEVESALELFRERTHTYQTLGESLRPSLSTPPLLLPPDSEENSLAPETAGAVKPSTAVEVEAELEAEESETGLELSI